jgi:hypothetical protein
LYGLKHQKEKRSMDHFAGLDARTDDRDHLFQRIATSHSD